MAAARCLAISSRWMIALQSLKAIPAAAADRSSPKDTLQELILQADVDCSCAVFDLSPEQLAFKGRMYLQPVLGVIIQELQIPSHLCNAVAALLRIPDTFHVAIQLLHHLTQILEGVKIQDTVEDPSAPALALALSTQIAASGLLQQLPAALKTAQQQLETLQPTGWCGGPCHFCEQGLGQVNTSFDKSGLADTTDTACANSLQHALLLMCTYLLDVWPGSLGPLGSAALGPVLLPAARLALSSLQYACRQAGELHTPSSSSSTTSSSSGSCPPMALVELGRAALDTCNALTHAAGAVTQFPALEPAAGLGSHAQELLCSPELLSAVVATFNADVYGQYDLDSSTAASTRDSTTGILLGFAKGWNPLPLMFMQVPDANLPTAAWQQVCARERQLQPNQQLLPPLQQQLMGTLGCNSKGFLWLAPVWKACNPPGKLYYNTLSAVLMMANSMHRQWRHWQTDRVGGDTDAALQQLLLLPALMLRRELQQQAASTSWDGQAAFNALRASTSGMVLMHFWRDLRELVACIRQVTARSSSGTDAAPTADEGPWQGLLAPVLHEVLQLNTLLLLGAMQGAEPGDSSSSRERSSNGSKSNTSSSGSNPNTSSSGTKPSTSSGSGKSSTSSGSGKRSTSSTGRGASASTKPSYEASTAGPAATATVLSCVIGSLLPLATGIVMKHVDSTPTGDNAASNSSSHSSSSSHSTAGSKSVDNASQAASWLPMLLQLTAALEQGMRFEAQHGLSTSDREVVVKFGKFSQLAQDAPRGSSAWMASFMLLSPAAHDEHGMMCGEGLGGMHAYGYLEQPVLLQWMLIKAPASQLHATQQRVLSLLCTMAKASLSPQSGKQRKLVIKAYAAMARTPWYVLTRLLPQSADPSSTEAAAAAADNSSSSSSSSKTPRSAASSTQAAAEAGNSSSSSSSIKTLCSAAPAKSQDSGCTFEPAAVLSWLSFMGRCFLQASQQISSTMMQHAAGSGASSSARQRTHLQQARGEPLVGTELCSICDLGAVRLPRCIMQVALLLAAASRTQLQQPLQQQPLQLPGQDVVSFPDVDKALQIPEQQQQLLQDAGRELAEHCSSIGLDLATVQQSVWALAETAAAAAPVLYKGVDAFSSMGVGESLLATQINGLMGIGLSMNQALGVAKRPVGSAHSSPETTAVAALASLTTQIYFMQLQAAGMTLSSLPTAAACNNLECSSLLGMSEGVSGKPCSACHLAIYCQRSCQKQHWGVHKPVCKAVQAAAATAVTASTGAAPGSSL